MKNKSESKADVKTKKNPFVKFLLGVLIFIAAIIVAVVLYLGINAFIKEDITKAVPSNYSLHLRTDSVWDSVEPMLDLEAADIVLADKSFVKYRELVLNFRQSKLRQNKFLKMALSRRIDLMMYDKDFLAVLDTGWLSGAVKAVPFALNFKAIKNLSYIKNASNSYFEYNLGESVLYIKIQKNLVIVTPSKELFYFASSLTNGDGHTVSQKKSFSEKLTKPFSITADGKKILNLVAEDNPYIAAISAALPENDLSTIDFGLTNHNVNLNVKIPLSLEEIKDGNPIVKLLKRESAVPPIVPKLPEPVQYYTVISAGTLEELKDAFFCVASEKMDLESKWKTAQNLSNAVFNESLENIAFSWTGNEYAVLGLEKKAEPVFVVKIQNEEKRKYVFEKVFSSIILKNDSSLLIDNVRLPRIQFPNYIQSLLDSFGIKLPAPYYMIKDGYVYFSQSAENLAALNASMKNGTRLAKNQMWKEISEDISQYSSLSLYYNLERSIPFFIQKNSLLSNVLQLYNVGRADFQIKDNNLVLQLNAIECKETSAIGIPGFPIALEGKATSELYKSNQKNSKNVYWLEGDSVKSFNASNLSVSARDFEKVKWILPASDSVKNKGELWCMTSDGTLYLVDEKLSDVEGFPLITGEIPTSNPAVYKDGILFSVKGQRLVYVSSVKSTKEYDVASFDDIASTPVILNSSAIVYEKSFMGGIHIVELENSEIENDFVPVEGIGFGSPAVITTKDNQYIGFVNQAGCLSVWDKNLEMPPNFPIELDGVFYTNVVSLGTSFIALSSDGTLSKISLDGKITKVKIPYLTAKKGAVTITDYNNDKADEIFVSGDGNSIYGFSSSLELLGSFPLSGFGVPVFVDLNGDKKNDCLTISLDNKLNGWKVN